MFLIENEKKECLFLAFLATGDTWGVLTQRGVQALFEKAALPGHCQPQPLLARCVGRGPFQTVISIPFAEQIWERL